MGTIVLVCAVLAALAAGVLAGYAVCVGMFGLFRIHAEKVARSIGAASLGSVQMVEG